MRSRWILRATWAWLVLSALLFGLAALHAYRERTSVWREVYARQERGAREEAAKIDGLVASLEAVADTLAGELEGGLSQGAVQARVDALLAGAPKVAVALQALARPAPGAGPAWSLASVRGGAQGHPRPAAAGPDLPATGAAAAQRAWSEPYLARQGHSHLLDFSRPFRPPGAAAGSGLVRLVISLEALNDLVIQLVPLAEGYGTLLSARGTYLADPRDELVMAGRTAAEVASDLNDAGRRQMAAAALRGERTFVQGVSGVAHQPVWIFLEPIPRNHWALAVLLLREDLPLRPPGWSRDMVALTTTGILLAWALLFLGCRGHRLEARNLWWISAGSSLVLAGAIGVIFHEAYTLPRPGFAHEVRITSPHALEQFKARNAALQVRLSRVRAEFLPTGVFIQTVEPSGTDLMKLTGHFWQRYPKGTPPEQRGVVLPELISGSVSPGPEVDLGDSVLQLFAFNAVIRQELNRSHLFPFDQTRIRLRIWDRRFYQNHILVPDLAAYSVLSPAALPGLDAEIDLPGWSFTGAEFGYVTETYNTDFGIADFAGQRNSPELVYSISLKRRFLAPFIAAFLPLLSVSGLLFVLLLSVSRDPEKLKATGYGFLNLLRTVIPLFFSLIVAQFNVRNRIAASGVLDLEWFYFVLYVATLAVSALALRFAVGGSGIWHAGDHRLPKLAFWPLILAAFYLIAVGFLG